MKKLHIIAAMLVIICLLCPMTAYAGTLPLPPEQTAVVDLMDGGAVENIVADSYTLLSDGEWVLEVQHVEAPGLTTALGDVAANGYYTADFMLPGTEKEVFLTGLTENNVEEIKQAIIEAYALGEDFELEDLGFIDAEKTREKDDDDEMCWAASSANILTYAGWAAQAGFMSADDVFERFIASYENKGGHPYYGIGWFFNGIDNFYQSNASAAKLTDPDSGGYLKAYDYDALTKIITLNKAGISGMNTLFDYLRDGYGVSLSFDLYYDGESDGGHSTTCWGYVADHRYTKDDKAYYTDILLTDSDSDELADADRRDAKDVMSCYALESFVQGSFDTYMIDFNIHETGIMRDSVALQPYSASLERETSAEASMDRVNDPDMRFADIYLSSQSGARELVTKFPTGSTVYYYPLFQNKSSAEFSGPFLVDVKVTDAQGQTIYTMPLDAGSVDLPSEYRFGFGSFPVSGLGAGDYTITFEINPSHPVQEAYFYNNVSTIDFKIRDTYLLGDFDDDNEVTGIDAVFIQRVDLQLETGMDDNALIRGDVDGSGSTNIIDATFVQRYATGFKVGVPHDIGQTVMYD